MKVGDLVHLDVRPKKISDPFSVIESHAHSKNVLNIGAAGGVHSYLPGAKDIWLHERMRKLANKLVGVDIDAKNIEHARNHGYEILNENCETMSLDMQFDLIVMSDVIEHVNAPVTAINNLLKHLADNGKLIITTPNATAGNVLIRSLLSKDINVLADHVAIYYPEHFQAICDRLNCKLMSVFLFDHFDRRNLSFKLKSLLFHFLTMVSLRLASSIMVIIEKDEP